MAGVNDADNHTEGGRRWGGGGGGDGSDRLLGNSSREGPLLFHMNERE